MEKPFMEIDNQIKQLRDGRGLLFNAEEHAPNFLLAKSARPISPAPHFHSLLPLLLRGNPVGF